jgi:hypothetical protein
MLSRVSLAIAVVLVVGFLFVVSRPDTYRIERSLATTAPPEAVFATVEDLRQFSRWSPWDARDPNLQRTFTGPQRGPGAQLSWLGNAEVGSGTLSITQATPPSSLRYLVVLKRPWRATIENDFRFARAADGAGATVTWVVSGKLGFWARLFTLFADANSRVGKDLEAGLAKLKVVVEARPAARERSVDNAAATSAKQ